jgi:hypothetical protein
LPVCSYHPNTIDINTDDVEYNWLLGVLEDQVNAFWAFELTTQLQAAVSSGPVPRYKAITIQTLFLLCQEVKQS